MAQILLVESDKQFAALLRSRLESKIHRDVIVKTSAEEAISLLQILPEVVLVIAKEQILKEQTFLKLSRFFNENSDLFEKPVPMLILGALKSDIQNVNVLPADSSSDEIVQMAAVILGLESAPDRKAPKTLVAEKNPVLKAPVKLPLEKTQPKLELPEKIEPPVNVIAEKYSSLSTIFYLNLNELKVPFDSYTRTKRKDKGYDYALKIPAESLIERSGIERLLTRGVSELYIKKEQFETARKFAEENIILKIFDQAVTGLDRIQLSSDTFLITLELVRQQRFDEFTSQLIEYNVSALKKIVQSDNVFILFENSRKIKNISYGFAHCFFTSLIMHKVLKENWVTDEIKNKIFYVLYLHDLSLAEEKLIYHHHHIFRDQKNLTEDEVLVVNNHALLAAQLAERLYPALGISGLIKEHHGIKSGKGFSGSLSIIASPFAMYLLTVEDFVTRYLDVKPEMSPEMLKEIFSALEKKYNKLSYQEALKALQNIYT